MRKYRVTRPYTGTADDDVMKDHRLRAGQSKNLRLSAKGFARMQGRGYELLPILPTTAHKPANPLVPIEAADPFNGMTVGEFRDAIDRELGVILGA